MRTAQEPASKEVVRCSEPKCIERRFCVAVIARRSQRRLSRIAKGLRTRCYSHLALARIANGDDCVPKYFRQAMDDPDDLILGMFALAVTAVMLVAGELYLMTRPEQPKTVMPQTPIVTSSVR